MPMDAGRDDDVDDGDDVNEGDWEINILDDWFEIIIMYQTSATYIIIHLLYY